MCAGRKVRDGSVRQREKWVYSKTHTSEPGNPNSGFSLCSQVDSTEGDQLHGSPDGDKLMLSALLRAASLALHGT